MNLCLIFFIQTFGTLEFQLLQIRIKEIFAHAFEMIFYFYNSIDNYRLGNASAT